MTTREQEFQSKLKELFREYNVSVKTEYGYYDEQRPYLIIDKDASFTERENRCRIFLNELTP